jgi:hypothetical protein
MQDYVDLNKLVIESVGHPSNSLSHMPYVDVRILTAVRRACTESTYDTLSISKIVEPFIGDTVATLFRPWLFLALLFSKLSCQALMEI